MAIRSTRSGPTSVVTYSGRQWWHQLGNRVASVRLPIPNILKQRGPNFRRKGIRTSFKQNGRYSWLPAVLSIRHFFLFEPSTSTIFLTSLFPTIFLTSLLTSNFLSFFFLLAQWSTVSLDGLSISDFNYWSEVSLQVSGPSCWPVTWAIRIFVGVGRACYHPFKMDILIATPNGLPAGGFPSIWWRVSEASVGWMAAFYGRPS